MWQRAMIALTEDLLATLKAPLADPGAACALHDLGCGEIQPVAIYETEQILARLRSLGEMELVTEFRSWYKDHPKFTAHADSGRACL